MSLLSILPKALSIIKDEATITALVPADSITFQRANQGIGKPYIVISVGDVQYTPTHTDEIATGAYVIEYNIFSDSAQNALTIHNTVLNYMKSAYDSDYDIRLFDEDYNIDNDGVHISSVSTVWRSNITQC